MEKNKRKEQKLGTSGQEMVRRTIRKRNYQSKMVKRGRNQQYGHAQQHPSVGPVLPVQHWPAPQASWHNPSLCPVLPSYHRHSQDNASEAQLFKQDPKMAPGWHQHDLPSNQDPDMIPRMNPGFPVQSQPQAAAHHRHIPSAPSIPPQCGSCGSSAHPKPPRAPTADLKVPSALPVLPVQPNRHFSVHPNPMLPWAECPNPESSPQKRCHHPAIAFIDGWAQGVTRSGPPQ